MRFRTLIATLLAAVATFAACEPVSITIDHTTKSDYLMLLSDPVMEFEAEGGVDVILYTFVHEEEVKQHTRTATLGIYTDAAWIELLDNHNDSTIDMHIAANEEKEARMATITLSYNTQEVVVTIKQAGKRMQPEPEKVIFEATNFYGLYHGDKYSSNIGNYFVYLSDLGFSEEGEALPSGTYYLLDLYAPLHEGEGEILLPAGTYHLDNEHSCAAWSISTQYSTLYDANSDSASPIFEAATLTVTDEGLTLTAQIEGTEHTVTYSGEMRLINKVEVKPEVVEAEMKHAWAYYLGDEHTPETADNFFLIMSDEGLNNDGSECHPGTYYRFDLYTPIINSEAGLALPHGTYTIDATNSYAPYTIGVSNSIYILYDAAGEYECIAIPASGTLTIDYDGITAEIMLNGKLHKVSFTGDATLYNNTSGEDNNERYSTLTGDALFDIKNAVFAIEYYGDYYDNGTDNWMVYVMEDAETMNGAYFVLDILCDPAADSVAGTYLASKEYSANTFIPGYVEWGNNFYSSWYVDMVNGELGELQAPITRGSFAIAIDGSNYTLTLNTYDDRGNAVKGCIEGSLLSEYALSRSALPTKQRR